MRNEEVDLREIIHELSEEWTPVAKEKGLDFLTHTANSVIIRESNYSMVLIMIQNAIINAIRYTPAQGSVNLSVYGGEESTVVEVSDTGNGIPPELIQQVKSGLVFLKDANSEKSGFGLQIMHKIAMYLDIELSIVSSEKGTKIQFAFKTT